MNAQLINTFKRTVDALNFDDEAFFVFDRVAAIQYDNYEMALEDFKIFFTPETATRSELLELLQLCHDLCLCNITDELIRAILNDDKPQARKAQPIFYEDEHDYPLLSATKAAFDYWLANQAPEGHEPWITMLFSSQPNWGWLFSAHKPGFNHGNE